MKELGEIIAETVAQIKAGNTAVDAIEEKLQREGRDNEGFCRYCGETEDLCPACGVCAKDHIMILGDAFAHLEAKDIREFGTNVLIARAADVEFHGPPPEVALAYISDSEMIIEVLRQEYEERKGELGTLDEDVWGSAFADLDLD